MKGCGKSKQGMVEGLRGKCSERMIKRNQRKEEESRGFSETKDLAKGFMTNYNKELIKRNQKERGRIV